MLPVLLPLPVEPVPEVPVVLPLVLPVPDVLEPEPVDPEPVDPELVLPEPDPLPMPDAPEPDRPEICAFTSMNPPEPELMPEPEVEPEPDVDPVVLPLVPDVLPVPEVPDVPVVLLDDPCAPGMRQPVTTTFWFLPLLLPDWPVVS